MREAGAEAPPAYAAEANALDEIGGLAVEVFRLNGALIAAGDRAVAPIGLTSARWQVLGAVTLLPHPGPVAHVARAMGLTRQNVRRIVGDLVEAGLLALYPNPNHRRAPLVVLTPQGAATFDEAMRRWAPWTRRLAATVTPEALAVTRSCLAALRAQLAVEESEDEPA